MPTITTNDGVQLYYEDVGEGPPLILIPGWSCAHHFFRKNTAALAKSCRVIAPDMRAHGDSEKVAWGHRIEVHPWDWTTWGRSLWYGVVATRSLDAV
jgi:pimeloyl-ACP methyl ester carboxylesterase